MLSDFLMALGIYSLVQSIINFFYSKKKHYKDINWSYQNKEICIKTSRTHFITGIIMIVLAIICIIIKK